MSLIYFHPYHIVDQSPWPLARAFAALLTTSGVAYWFKGNSSSLIYIGLLALVLTSAQWWRDISREATLQGHHPIQVETNIRLGIILFIASEVLFFVSFFWAFFHSRLAPTVEIGITWPPKNIAPFNPFQIPLLNTIILLSSGISVTWAHHRLIENNHTQTIKGLAVTIILGLYFSALQAFEYIEAPFTFADSVYGSTFYIATGFHGLHVIVGTRFLIVCIYRLSKFQFSYKHHFGFEAAAWYWHFVDVVWLFLFITIYWWGSFFSSIKIIPHFQWENLQARKRNINSIDTPSYHFFIGAINYYNRYSLRKKDQARPRKNIPLRVRILTILYLPNPILPAVFYNRNHFPSIWCRNYNSPSLTHSSYKNFRL